jgi:hypothetical protein
MCWVQVEVVLAEVLDPDVSAAAISAATAGSPKAKSRDGGGRTDAGSKGGAGTALLSGLSLRHATWLPLSATALPATAPGTPKTTGLGRDRAVRDAATLPLQKEPLRGGLADAVPGVALEPLPLVRVQVQPIQRPCQEDDKGVGADDGGSGGGSGDSGDSATAWYACPLYRAPLSENREVVASFRLPSTRPAAHWALRGVALEISGVK